MPTIMLISQDPTTDFQKIYENSRKYCSEVRRRVLFDAGIPLILIVRITWFLRRMDYKPKIDIKKELLDKIYKFAYWTHLHKCPTDENHKFTELCADNWLKGEIEAAQEDGVKTIVCLGKAVKDWIEKNIDTKKTRIIYLPHPSCANNAEWYTKDKKKKEDIEKNSKKLMNLCSKL